VRSFHVPETLHQCLAAEFAFHADLARNARDFIGERRQLVHHGVDRIFQFEDFAFNIHGDFPAEIARGDGGGYGRNVAHLSG